MDTQEFVCQIWGGTHWTREVSGMESSLLEGEVVKWKMEDVCYVQDESCGATIPSVVVVPGKYFWNFHPDNLGK